MTIDPKNAPQILLLEQNDYALKMTTDMLRSAGFRNVTGLTKASRLLPTLSAKSFDLLIVSSELDELTGNTVLQAVRKSEDFVVSNVPALVLFAHPKATKVREAQELDNTQVLAKPVSPNQLKERISKALSAPDDGISLEDF